MPVAAGVMCVVTIAVLSASRHLNTSSSLLEPPSKSVEAASRFEATVLPVLNEHCRRCHGPEKAKSNLRLDSLTLLMKGGRSGSVFVAGQPEASELYRRITLPADADDVMPPDGSPLLSPHQISLLHAWIANGASGEGPLRGVADESARELQLPPPLEPAAKLPKLRQLAAALYAQLQPISQQGNAGLILRAVRPGRRFGDPQLRELGEAAPFVVDAELAQTALSNDGLATLSTFVNLRRLDLSKTLVRGQLGDVSRLSHLEVLNLTETNVDDQAVATLVGAKSLRKLYLFGTRVTRQGLERLRAAMPWCQIVPDAGHL
jgi:hypothetical protein